MATSTLAKLIRSIPSNDLNRSSKGICTRKVAGYSIRRRTAAAITRNVWSPSWRQPFAIEHDPSTMVKKEFAKVFEPVVEEPVVEVPETVNLEEEMVAMSRVVDMPIFQEVTAKSGRKVEVSPIAADEAAALPQIGEEVFRPRITVVGIGGGGCNAVNNMIQGRLEGVDFMVCNTDAQSLESNACENRLQLGENATGGFGAGSNPEVGRVAAQESVSKVISKLHGSHMVFLTAGLGGGTGTGAAPVIANACRNEGILTVAIVTMPFEFEGKRTREVAQTGLQKLQDQVDTVIVVPNQKLLSDKDEDMPLLSAFGIVDDILLRGIQGVTDLITRPGIINTDFADLKRVMQSNSGRGLMGTGEAEGENRAALAATAALEHPLLDDVDISAARRVLVTITSSSEITMQEVAQISTSIQARVNAEALIIFGVTIAKEMENKLRVSVVATDMAESASSFDPSFSTSSHSSSSRKRSKSSKDHHKSSHNNDEGGFFRGWF